MPLGDWLHDQDANKFNNSYFRDANNTGFAVDMSGDLIVRGNLNMNKMLVYDYNANQVAIRHSSVSDVGATYSMMISYAGGINLNTSNNQYMGFRVGGVEKMILAPNGNVGIGTTNPTQKLHVNGNFYATSSGAKLAVNGNTVIVGHETSGHNGYKIFVHGALYASGSVDSGSDNRIKHNEQPILNALETIRKLQPYHYIKTESLWDENHNFNLDSSNNPVDEIRYDSSGNQLKSDLYDNSGNAIYRREDGIIAQDILQIPELAHTVVAPQNDIQPYGVDYNSIIIRSIAGLKELDNIVQQQQAIILELQSENTTLKTQMGDVLTRLTALENA